MINEIEKLDEYFRVQNYLSVAQIYLKDNPLLKRELRKTDVKERLIGHFGSAPGQNFIYLHLNRVINKFNLNMFYVSGPGHSGQAIIGSAYLEETYTEIYPEYTQDEEGLKKLCKMFSFPGGTSSHVAPEVPGSINEGGELGYSLAKSYGAVIDNPDLIVGCVVGDGEAETGPLSGSWHANKLINPIKDGAVLPILHLNGYKIANPTILSRISEEELLNYFKGMGYDPVIVEGYDPAFMHREMIKAMDKSILKIKSFQNKARISNKIKRDFWPLIILKTPKGWLGIKEYDGVKIEGTSKSHQVPISSVESDEDLKLLEKWLLSYKVKDLFDEKGELVSRLKELNPKGNKRMSANPHANGGLLLKEIVKPDLFSLGFDIKERGTTQTSDMYNLGKYIREVVRLNKDNYLITGPDEALSNKLDHVFEVTNKKLVADLKEHDYYTDMDGKVIDAFLSEHLCEGLLEGYILTGRHGFMHSYEAFIRVIDSMTAQHGKWLKLAKEKKFRKDISSLNYIITSHVWQQDHNGYTHQDPGFLNHLASKKESLTGIYLPFDANTLICAFDHVIGTKNKINAITASKHDRLQWMDIKDAKSHFDKGIDIFDFASDDNPDIILACAGDTPTLEVLAAKKFLKENIPELNVRVVNVINLFKLSSTHPDGLSDKEFNKLFTTDLPVIFAFHGYSDLIYSLVYKRTNKNFHVHGYMEEGTITTPFDMRVLNKMDRYNLSIAALKNSRLISENIKSTIKKAEDILKKHNEYIKETGKDLDEILNFKW